MVEMTREEREKYDESLESLRRQTDRGWEALRQPLLLVAAAWGCALTTLVAAWHSWAEHPVYTALCIAIAMGAMVWGWPVTRWVWVGIRLQRNGRAIIRVMEEVREEVADDRQ